MNNYNFKENGAAEDVKQDLCIQLDNYKGGSYYGADLAYQLFEGDNANGSVFCNTYKTEQYIKANWDLFGELVEYCKDNLGMALNPFSEPEKAHVIFELEAAQRILSACPLVDKNWNTLLELTPKNIKTLKKQIMEFSGELF